jgi:hypothetical protein
MTDETRLLWLIPRTSIEIYLTFLLASRRETVQIYIQSMRIHPASVPGRMTNQTSIFGPLQVLVQKKKKNVSVHLFQYVSKVDLRAFQLSCLAE